MINFLISKKRGVTMIKAYARSDIGKARDINQDSFYITEDSFSDIQLFILADGMGGYTGGEIASKLACSSSANYIKENFKEENYTKEGIMLIIKKAMIQANQTVYEKAKQLTGTRPSYPQDGYIFEKDGLIVVNLGEHIARWKRFDFKAYRSLFINKTI